MIIIRMIAHFQMPVTWPFCKQQVRCPLNRGQRSSTADMVWNDIVSTALPVAQSSSIAVAMKGLWVMIVGWRNSTRELRRQNLRWTKWNANVAKSTADIASLTMEIERTARVYGSESPATNLWPGFYRFFGWPGFI